MPSGILLVPLGFPACSLPYTIQIPMQKVNTFSFADKMVHCKNTIKSISKNILEETTAVREQKISKIPKKYTRIVISCLLSVINIHLAVSLELWTKSAGKAAVALFGGAGAVVGALLIDRFLRPGERRLKVYSLLWGALMTAAYVLGCLMRRDGTAFGGGKSLPVQIASLLCLTISAAACIAPLLQGLSRPHRQLYKKLESVKKYRLWQVWLFYGAVIFLCWMPVFLAYYPSVFAYDAEGQLYQVIAHDYSTHHPLLHTLFLGAFFRLGGVLFGSYPAGMAVHSVVQMLLMAAAFGYAAACLYRWGVPVCLRAAMLIFYALFPTNSILAISTTKDVLFSAFVLLFTLSVCGLADDAGEGREFGRKGWLLYMVWAALLLLFRNNAVYAFVLTVPCLSLGLRKSNPEGVWKRYLLYSVAAFVLFAAGSAALRAATGAHRGSPREMLSVPLQQMARTRVKAEGELSPEMRRELEKYLPSEWVAAAYNPHLADPVKNRAVIHDDPAGLIRTWAKLGVSYPRIYVDAFLDNSIGYWFIEDRTHARIYGIGAQSGFGYLSTDNRAMPAGCEITEHSYLPGLRAWMEHIVSDNAYQKAPLIRVVFAPAFYWWMLCLYIAAALYRREYRLLLPAVFLLFYYLTLLLSPTVLIRYMYPFVVTVPVLCCRLSARTEESNEKSIQ